MVAKQSVVMVIQSFTLCGFFSDIELYRNAVDSFINVMDHLAKQVEREKLDAIISSNKLASLSNKTNEEVAMLQVRM